ncbi:unnamed protein product [Phytophthora fragariaefolia]|uniref:Unnamed protein product n=1 Tax=Phytophthora fragariaefolia TaxID=1490495 RepID=A0A9W6Y9B3_9STRA|nr:unnamed protein product [Phytophthora fragariaefolia]
MSIASLVPANSKKARLTAINSFKVFLEAEAMTLDKAHGLIGGDSTVIVRIVLDRYAYSLARLTNKARSTNTCRLFWQCQELAAGHVSTAGDNSKAATAKGSFRAVQVLQ